MRTVISIGSDRSLFESGSVAAARMRLYGSVFRELHIIVFSKKKHRFSELTLAENVWVYPTNSLSKFSYMRDAVRLGERIALEKSISKENLVVTAQDPFESGLVARTLSRRTGGRFHLQIHTDFLSREFIRHSLLNYMRVVAARRMLPMADAVRVVSRRIADSIRIAGISLRRPVVILPIFSPRVPVQPMEVTAIEERYPAWKRIVLVSSRFTKEKDIYTAIRAFCMLRRYDASTGLLIVGNGPERRRLSRYARGRLPAGSYVFEGWQQNLSAYYEAADLFLNTSRYEGYGLTLIEAARARCPIVSTDVGIARELIGDEFSRCVVPVGDYTAVFMALKKLLEDQTLYARYAGALSERALALSAGGIDEYVRAYRDSIEACFNS